MVDPAPIGGAIAAPLPESQRRKLKKLDLPELAGARQALGSQLIDGALPRPVIDFISTDAKVRERISFFEGGLVVIDVTGSGATIRKRLIVPPDAFRSYTTAITAAHLSAVRAVARRCACTTRRGITWSARTTRCRRRRSASRTRSCRCRTSSARSISTAR